ncbi:uPF0102 protein HMPREF0991_01614 [Clostridium sp. CAG:58]|nr:uPF0102 protein HMPREF0991_01614 [Clostridium sp. CAG:58]
MGQNKRMEGSRYEQLAARYLEQKGMDVLELNYRCRTGEIDIIARDGGYLVFVEVKYRKTKRAGYALEAIDSRKAGRSTAGRPDRCAGWRLSIFMSTDFRSLRPAGLTRWGSTESRSHI